MLDSGHGMPSSPGTNRTALVVIVAIVGVLIVGGAATLIAVNSDDAEPAAASTTSPSPRPTVPTPKTPQHRNTDPAPGPTRTPTIPPPAVPTPGESVPTQPARSAGLRFKPLQGKWHVDLQTSQILRGVGQIQVTEPRYDGQSNWVAMIAAGQAPPGTFHRGDLRASAKRLSTWFVSEGFTGTKVQRRTLDAKPIKVDGHQAFLLKQHFSYSVPGLTSDGETVSIVVADLGKKGGASRGGAFIASIPITDKQLNGDVEKALKTLHVAG